jgi:hypothetical protein
MGHVGGISLDTPFVDAQLGAQDDVIEIQARMVV